MPETSVIIRSFNEAEFIEDTLDAVDEQRYRDFEVVLVDSGSTDETLDVAAPRVDTVAEIDPRDFTFGYSLNAGCAAARGDYYAFLSAHARPTDDRWLGRMVRHFEDDDVAMVYSNQTGVEATKFSEQRYFDAQFGERRKRQRPPDYFANNASSAVRASLHAERPFDEYLTGLEDVDWAKHFMDRGYVVVYEPESCIYHVHDETWEQVYTRFEREAIARREIGVRDRTDRWWEYLATPRDVVADLVAAYRDGELDAATAREIALFRAHQHAGTASGLASEPELEDRRYEFFYDGANRSVVVEGPENAGVADRPLPEVRPNDVLVAVAYAGVCERDRRLFAGDLEPEIGGRGSYPLVPGHEFVGRVVDAGANVESVAAGDTVAGSGAVRAVREGERHRRSVPADAVGLGGRDGAFARFLTAPSESVRSVPDDLPHRTAPLAAPLAVVLDGLDRVSGAAGPPETAAVLGGDVFGHLAARALLSRGAAVTVYDGATGVAERLPTGVPLRPTPVSASDLGDADLIVTTPRTHRWTDSPLEAIPHGAALLSVSEPFTERPLDAATVAARDHTVVGASFARPSLFATAVETLPALDADALVGPSVPLTAYERAIDALSGDAIRPVLVVVEG